MFSGVREPGTVTPRRRSLNSMKYPPDSSGFEKRSFADLQKTYSRCDNTCCICLEEYDETAKLTKLPCNHWMHSECIEKWFNRDVTCPLCKEIAIEKPYNEALVPIPDGIDANSDSGTSNNSRWVRATKPPSPPSSSLPLPPPSLSLSLFDSCGGAKAAGDSFPTLSTFAQDIRTDDASPRLRWLCFSPARAKDRARDGLP